MDIKNILIKGFEALFQLLQNDKTQFEAKKKEFQESIDISNKNNEEKFSIIENKEELNNNPNSNCNNESEKDSSNSLNKESKCGTSRIFTFCIASNIGTSLS